jgi:hypothetical protein
MSYLLAKSGQPSQPTIVKYVLRPNTKASAGPTPGYVDTPPMGAPNKQDGGVGPSQFQSLFPTH